MQITLSRRAVLAGVPAVAAVAALPAIPALAAQDPHPKWWAERQAWHRKMSAIGKEINRREAALPAEVRAPVPLISPPYENHLLADWHAKVARREAAYEQIGYPRLDAEFDQHSDRAAALERLIHDTEARTAAGLAIQLRLLEFRATTDETDPEDVGRIAAGLERLAGGGAA